MKNKKIKICHFVNRITGRDDGVFKHLIGQLVYLDKEKFDQFVIYQGGEDVERIFRTLNIKYFIVKELEKKFSLKIFLKVYKIIINENVDIINAHLIKPYSIAGLLNIFLKKKLVFSYHGLFIRNDYNSKFEQVIYRVIHFLIKSFNNVYVLTPSKKSIEILLNETKNFKNINHYYQGKALYKYSNGVNESLIEELKEYKSKYVVLGNVGRLNREKNVKLCLELFLDVCRIYDNIILLIFGDGEEKEYLIEFVKAKKLNDKVKFFGYVENISSYMQYFDILILTSKREGMPIVLWEAMDNAIPILSTNVGGIPEIVELEKCGYTFDLNNIRDGVEKLNNLVTDEELRKEMGNRGKEAIETKYTLDDFKDFFTKFYSGLSNE